MPLIDRMKIMSKINFLFIWVIAGSMMLSLNSCGNEGGGERPPEFSTSVNVNEIRYQLKDIQIEAKVRYTDNTEQEFKNVFESNSMLDEERIIRKTVDNIYTLEVNGERASINVGGSSGFDYRVLFDQEDGCRIIGEAKARGFARFDSLELDYDLKLELQGDDCPKSIENEFVEIQNQELGGLNLSLIQNLRDSGLLKLEDSEFVDLKIRISGDAN